MRKVSAAAIALLAAVAVSAPAFAQAPGMGDKETPLQKQEKIREEERKAIERDYEKTMKRLKSQGATTTSSDPWATVRPAAEVKNETKNEPKKNEPKKREAVQR